MFRGNPTRTWYGTGPLPDEAPSVLWRYPKSAMCGSSSVGGEFTTWCGTGWTGQPSVWVRPDGITEVVFGAYDKAVHFVNAETGEATRPKFQTGDIIKGSVSIDPDGFPLVYTGSRDNKFRIIALDREEPVELWSLDASAVKGIWNNDWDSNPVILDDLLLEGGENGWFFIIKLNRGYDADGKVKVEPERIFETPSYNDELLAKHGPNVSVENSVAVYGRRVYFGNSGGRILGFDFTDVEEGKVLEVFDFWVGDDVDASIVIDEEGMLYVSVELEKFRERSREVGQLVKLNPKNVSNPIVWGLQIPGAGGGDGGLWATPAYKFGHLYVTTHSGRLLAVDAETGSIDWEEPVGAHSWSSPVIVDNVLLVGTCYVPQLRAYSLEDPSHPQRIWTLENAAGGCIESTPAVWDGVIYVGSRDGYVRAYK